jgi:hypothetical protein
MWAYIIPIILFAIPGYFALIFIFDLLLRGFYPFIPSRPWVVEQLMVEIKLRENKAIKVLAFSSGRSGFFYSLREKYPKAELIGYEHSLFPFLVAKTQNLIRRSKIEVRKSMIHRVEVADADFIYCHLNPDQMRDLGKKFKFECRPGTKIVSTGFNIPFLEPVKIIELPDKKGRFNFLSKNQNLFQSKRKKFKKEKKAYFYEI